MVSCQILHRKKFQKEKMASFESIPNMRKKKLHTIFTNSY
jgi:hypothetical protein